MKKHLFLSLLALFLMGALFVGCSPVNPDEAIDTTAKNLTVASNKIIDAINSIQDLSEFKSFYQNASFMSYRDNRYRDSRDARPAPTMKINQLRPEKLKDFLSKYVFIEDNMTRQAGSISYLIKGDRFCEALYHQNKYRPNGQMKRCAVQIDQLKIRLSIKTPDADTAILSLSINDGESIVTLTATPKKVSVQADLTAFYKALIFYYSVNGQKLPLDFPKIEGALSLSFDHAADLLVKLSIDRDISVKGKTPRAKSSYSFTLKKQDGVFTTKYDKKKKKVSLGLNFNSLKAILPGRDMFGTEKIIELFLAGLSANFSLGAGKAFEMTNIGLGDTTSSVKIANKTVLKVDLNKNSGRRFGLKLGSTNNSPEITITSGLDLLAFIDMTVIKKEAKQLGSWALGNTFQLLLKNGKSDPVVAPSNGRHSIIKIIKGSLTLKNITAKKELSVLEGFCLVQKSGAKTDGTSLLDTLASAVCPKAPKPEEKRIPDDSKIPGINP